LAVGGGRIWVATQDDSTLSMVDPETLSRSHISLRAQPAGMAYWDGNAYVLSEEKVGVIDSAAAAQTAWVPAPVVGDPNAIASGPAGVWAATDDSLFKVAKAGPYGAITAPTVDVPWTQDEEHQRGAFNGVAVGDNRVWAVGDVGDPTLWTLDPGTLRITSRRLPVAAPGGVAVGYGSVWVTDQIANTVVRVDAVSGRVIGLIPVGREPIGIAVGDDGVWVANAADDTVSRIDPATGRVAKTFDVGDHPSQVAVGEGSVWIGEAPAP
jgi:YVTN family beta-propeller protein